MTFLGWYTLFHVLLSLIGIATGFVVLAAMLRSRLPGRWTAWFLTTTIATSATGFGFPVDRFLRSHAIAILSLVLLAIAVAGLYLYRLSGRWRATYVITAVAAQYFNVLVLIVQSFLKVPSLHELAPQQNEPPFVVAQLINLAVFVGLGIVATKRFHPAQPTRAG